MTINQQLFKVADLVSDLEISLRKDLELTFRSTGTMILSSRDGDIRVVFKRKDEFIEYYQSITKIEVNNERTESTHLRT